MKNDTRQQGMALIAALGALVIFTLLIGMAVALSQLQRFTVATSTQLGESVYRNESALNRTIWLLLNDRLQYPDRSLKPKSDALLESERFQADGLPRVFELDGTPVEVIIRDMNRGLNLAGANPAAAFAHLTARLERNPERRRELDSFRDKLLDYVDSDELLRPEGWERGDYEAAGAAPLPRNGPLQFREEVLWIPGAEPLIRPDGNGILSDLNLIPPRGLPFAAGKPHFFSVSPELIAEKCDFTDRELEIVTACRRRIAAREIAAEEAFAPYPLFYETLKKNFAFAESPCYTVEIRIAPETQLPGRALSASFRATLGSGEEAIQFYQYLLQ